MDTREMIPLMKRYEELDIENDGRKDVLLPEQETIKGRFAQEGLRIGVDGYGFVAVWIKER